MGRREAYCVQKLGKVSLGHHVITWLSIRPLGPKGAILLLHFVEEHAKEVKRQEEAKKVEEKKQEEEAEKRRQEEKQKAEEKSKKEIADAMCAYAQTYSISCPSTVYPVIIYLPTNNKIIIVYGRDNRRHGTQTAWMVC